MIKMKTIFTNLYNGGKIELLHYAALYAFMLCG